MKEEIKEAADKMVEKYQPKDLKHPLYKVLSDEDAVHCTIVECQSLIDELNLIQECLSDSPSHAKVYQIISSRISHYQSIKEYLSNEG